MKHSINTTIAMLSVAMAHAGPSVVAFDPPSEVTLTELGTLGGRNSEAYDINNRGVVVGWAEDTNEIAQAFYHVDGVMYLLDAAIGPHTNVATGINNLDQVVGTLEHLGATQAFSGRLGLPVTVVGDGGRSSRAAAISDAGFIVGTMRGDLNPAMWMESSGFAPLPGGFMVADVNSSAEAVGADDVVDATVWRREKGRFTQQCVPYFTGGSCLVFSHALGINNAGAVVGAYFGSDDLAFYWDGHSATSVNLGTLPSGSRSLADDVNDQDFVVGWADQWTKDSGLTLESAFLYHRDFGMFALPKPKTTPWFGHCRAKALNERNATTGVVQVAGTCDSPEGKIAVRWDVKVTSRPDIPPLPYPPVDPRPAP